jgi:uncharacterized OB-fold protein
VSDIDWADWYGQRPRPDADHVSMIFWDGLAIGELRYQSCPRCGTVQFYPRAVCTGCGDQPTWRVASGLGNVHTFTVIRQNGARPFREQVPYVVAMIEVPEGFRMMGNIVDVDPADVSIGLPVEASFVAVDDGYAVVVWRLAPAAGR